MQHVIFVKNELKKLLVTLRNESEVKSRHMSLVCTHMEDAVLRLDACEREAGREVDVTFEPSDLLDPIAVEPAKHPVLSRPAAVEAKQNASVARAPRPPLAGSESASAAPPDAPSRTTLAEDPTKG